MNAMEAATGADSYIAKRPAWIAAIAFGALIGLGLWLAEFAAAARQPQTDHYILGADVTVVPGIHLHLDEAAETVRRMAARFQIPDQVGDFASLLAGEQGYRFNRRFAQVVNGAAINGLGSPEEAAAWIKLTASKLPSLECFTRPCSSGFRRAGDGWMVAARAAMAPPGTVSDDGKTRLDGKRMILVKFVSPEGKVILVKAMEGKHIVRIKPREDDPKGDEPQAGIAVLKALPVYALSSAFFGATSFHTLLISGFIFAQDWMFEQGLTSAEIEWDPKRASEAEWTGSLGPAMVRDPAQNAEMQAAWEKAHP